MEDLAMNTINKANKVQMTTKVDSRTGMVMYVETCDGVIDLRPYGATCDNSGYQGMDYDYD